MTGAAINANILKEFRKLARELPNETNNQAFIELEGDNIMTWKLTLRINDGITAVFTLIAAGLWRGAQYHFDVCVEDQPIHVHATDEIFHPNIAPDGEICLNILSEWENGTTIEQVIHGILFLFYQPNPEDPMHGPACISDDVLMRETIVASLHGRLNDMNIVEDIDELEGDFDQVTADPEWDFENDCLKKDVEMKKAEEAMRQAIEKVLALKAAIAEVEAPSMPPMLVRRPAATSTKLEHSVTCPSVLTHGVVGGNVEVDAPTVMFMSTVIGFVGRVMKRGLMKRVVRRHSQGVG